MCFRKKSHLCVMFLLGVPVSRFPPIAASPTCSLSRPFSLVPRRWLEPEVPPAPLIQGVGMSVYLANPTPDTLVGRLQGGT